MGKSMRAKSKATQRRGVSRKQKTASAFQDMVDFFKSPVGERFIVLEIFIFSAMTVLIYILYQKELKKRDEIHKAMDIIRTFVVGTNPFCVDKDGFVAFIKSPIGEHVVIFTIIALSVLTLLIFVLYQRELKKREDFKMAIDMIRTFVVGLDTIHEDKDDFQILAVAQNKSEEMRALANINDEIQKEIDRLIGNLNDGWVIYSRQFYLFSTHQDSWKDSIKRCEREGAVLASFETVEEKRFVSKEVRNRRNWYWFGLFKKEGKWRWLSGILATVTYWYDKEPKPGGECGAMSTECKDVNCWVALHCERRQPYICKKVPDDAWL